MRLVVDTNIFISALPSPESTIADLIINKIYPGSLFAPHFLFDELLSKQLKIIKISGYSQKEFHDLMYLFIKRI